MCTILRRWILWQRYEEQFWFCRFKEETFYFMAIVHYSVMKLVLEEILLARKIIILVFITFIFCRLVRTWRTTVWRLSLPHQQCSWYYCWRTTECCVEMRTVEQQSCSNPHPKTTRHLNEFDSQLFQIPVWSKLYACVFTFYNDLIEQVSYVIR